MSEQRPRSSDNGHFFKQNKEGKKAGENKGGGRNARRKGKKFEANKAGDGKNKTGGNKISPRMQQYNSICTAMTTPECIEELKSKFPKDFEKHRVICVCHVDPIKEVIEPIMRRMKGFSASFFPEDYDERSSKGKMWTQFKMRTFDQAAEAIVTIRLAAKHGFIKSIEKCDFDKHTRLNTKRDIELRRARRGKMEDGGSLTKGQFKKAKKREKEGSKNDHKSDSKRIPPTKNHKTLCVNCREHKDYNALRNLALAVGDPAQIKSLGNKNRQNCFTGFIEMKTQDEALELYDFIVENEPEITALWAKEDKIFSDNMNLKKMKKMLSQWGDNTVCNLISASPLSEKKVDALIPEDMKEFVDKKKLTNTLANNFFYNELHFRSAETARSFFHFCYLEPIKGVDVKPATHRVNTQAYLSKDEVEAGLKTGDFLKSALRISSNYQNAFVSDPNGGSDLFIQGRKDQNRALPNDIVAYKIKPKEAWVTRKTGETQRTAEVVAVLDSKSNKRCAGVFAENMLSGVHSVDLLFVPCDNRLPRMLIAKSSLAEDMAKKIKEIISRKIIFEAKIIEWEEGAQNARAVLTNEIGDPEDLQVQMDAILVDKSIDTRDWETFDVDDELPGKEWTITDEQVAKRRDFRNECVFTIDPATARDLDDALHVKRLDDNVYEVGVHIADVAFFVKPGGKIDKVASERCTSTYMPDRVVPMLPRRLCEELCSLNPLVERYSFSVVFKLDAEGNYLEEPWYGRGLIKSCVKFSYENAQHFIENPEEENIDESDFPEVLNGYSLETIRHCVLMLDMLSKKLREKRVANGCIRIEQPKIGFTWDEATKTPNGFFPYIRKDAHMMIEDFMLLANIAVAEKIERHFPDRAFLRQHPPPNQEKITEVVEELRKHGINIDHTSSRDLARSLEKVTQEMCETNSENAQVFQSALSLLTVKTMQLAKYICTNDVEDRYDYRHYALAVPLYTHFTSPIRRYADLVVHRQLAAAIGWDESFETPAETLTEQAESCNERKLQAKLAGEDGSDVYLWCMIKRITKDSEFIMDGVVTGLVEYGLEILLHETGFTLRIYYGEMLAIKYSIFEKNGYKAVAITWAKDNKPLGRDSVTNTPNKSRPGEALGTTDYAYFTPVRVSVVAGRDPGRLDGKLLPPAHLS